MGNYVQCSRVEIITVWRFCLEKPVSSFRGVNAYCISWNIYRYYVLDKNGREKIPRLVEFARFIENYSYVIFILRTLRFQLFLQRCSIDKIIGNTFLKEYVNRNYYENHGNCYYYYLTKIITFLLSTKIFNHGSY